MTRLFLAAVPLLLVASSAAPAADPVMCLGQPATIVGTEGPDRITGTAEPDVIHLLGGSDWAYGAEGNDLLCGGSGRDTIFVSDTGAYIDLENGFGAGQGTGNDTFESFENAQGSRESDALFGSERRNVLSGRQGDDYLDGRSGNDRLVGGAGNNFGDGGPGFDRCRDGTYENCEAS